MQTGSEVAAGALESLSQSTARLESAKADDAKAAARAASAAADLAEVEVERERLKLAFEAEERVLWNPTPQLLEKVAKASGQIEMAAKSGYNKEHKYDYATFADYLKAVRKPLADAGLWWFQHQVGDPQYSGKNTKSNSVWLVSRVLIETRIVDPETGGWVACRAWGEGHDPTDKANYKAMTGGRKYSLAMLLGIHTEDDPEKDTTAPAPEHEPEHSERQRRRRDEAPRQDREPSPRPEPPTPPLPPAESARSWTDKAQAVLIEKLETLDATEEESHFTRVDKFITYILGKRADGMTHEQFDAACRTLITRADTFRVGGQLSPEECSTLLAKISGAYSPTTTAAQMPGATQPEEGAT
jgi:hypothetical protein